MFSQETARLHTLPVVLAMICTSAIAITVLFSDSAAANTVPTFKIRIQVQTIQGSAPSGKQFTTFLSAPQNQADPLTPTLNVSDSAWSDWMAFDATAASTNREKAPNKYLGEPTYGPDKLNPYWGPNFEVVTLRINGISDPTTIKAEVLLDETATTLPLDAELHGSSLGLVIYRDPVSSEPRVDSMKTFNHDRYGANMAAAAIPASDRPKSFTIQDGFFPGDSDADNFRQGIQRLQALGINTFRMPSTSYTQYSTRLANEVGVENFAAFFHTPVHDFNCILCANPLFDFASQTGIQNWANRAASDFRDAGGDPAKVKTFQIHDEPRWPYPEAIAALNRNTDALGRFRTYLQNQDLKPQDVGHTSWTEVEAAGSSLQTGTLAQRKLFYWSMRFMAWDATRFDADKTKALQTAFHGDIRVFSNWNNAQSRLFSPGSWVPQTVPDFGTGSYDWMEVGRMKGASMLFTEDWFSDPVGYTWSYYANRLASAAAKSDLTFGGHITLGSAGQFEKGIMQKAMTQVGHGAKSIYYYVFGPSYNVPRDGYSDQTITDPDFFPNIAEANQLIGVAEDLLWPGKPAPASVAILAPRSSTLWDRPNSNNIYDFSSQVQQHTADYGVETRGLSLAMTHANVPHDFVDEDDLTAAGLAKYEALYITEPNIPREHQEGIVAWVRAGGTLVEVSGAGSRDRYNDPSNVLSGASGIEEQQRQPYEAGTVPMLVAAPQVGTVSALGGSFTALGVRGSLTRTAGTSVASFGDGPAVLSNVVGSGKVFHFSFLPGLSYWASDRQMRMGSHASYPTEFSDVLRDLITSPTRAAGVRPLVETGSPYIEAPVLTSTGGSAITLLRWDNAPAADVSVRYRAPFAVSRVNSAKRGDIAFTKTSDGIAFTVASVDGADVVRVYRRGNTGRNIAPIGIVVAVLIITLACVILGIRRHRARVDATGTADRRVWSSRRISGSR